MEYLVYQVPWEVRLNWKYPTVHTIIVQNLLYRKGSTIEVVVPINWFMIFHCAFAHCGTLFWCIDKGNYHSNARAFFIIVKKSFYIFNEIVV